MELIEHQNLQVAEECDMSPMETYIVCTQLQKICEDSKGLGISAVQVGLPKKLFLVKYPQGYRYFVNCSYLGKGKKLSQTIEGCLSLPRRFFVIENHRYEEITVTGKELVIKDNEPIFVDIALDLNYRDQDLLVIVFQHEIDHQLGQDGLILNLKSSREIMIQKVKY